MNWKWRLSHARGYRELGLFGEARAELAQIPAPHADQIEVLAEHAGLYQESGDWPELAAVCRVLAHRDPENAGWWIMWAYGARRSESLAAAEKILLIAEAVHRTDATIQFNLGCYACQLGNLGAAQARVARAITLDAHFRELAQTDADLEPLRKLIADPWG